MLVTGQFTISTFPLCLRVSCPPAQAGSFAYALFTFLSGQLTFRREDKDNAHAKLFASVGGQETRKQSALWEMWKWRMQGLVCRYF